MANILDWTYKLLRWGLGIVFIAAGGAKLLEPQVFAALIEAYGLIPEGLVFPGAIILPVFEIVAGIGLMLDIRGSLAAIAGLLILFVGVLGYGIEMGLDVDCGCFGPEDPEGKAFHGLQSALYRDLVMLGGVVFIYSWRRFRAIKPKPIRVVADKIIS